MPHQRPAGIPGELLLGGRPAGPRHPGRVQAGPVLEPGEPGRPRADDRPGDLGPDRGPDHPLRRERRDRRHDHRRGPRAQGPQPDDPGHRRRPRGQRPVRRHRPPVPDRGRRRGLHARARTTRRSSIGGSGSATATRSRWPAASPARRGSCPAARAGPRWSPRARSSASSPGRPTAADAVVVVLLPDSGRSYLSKIYNDEWMRANGLLATTGAATRVAELLADRHHAPDMPAVVVARTTERVGDAIATLQAYGISQLPGVRGRRGRRGRRARRLDQREGPARPGVPRPERRRADRRRGHGSAAAAGRGVRHARRGVRAAVRWGVGARRGPRRSPGRGRDQARLPRVPGPPPAPHG